MKIDRYILLRGIATEKEIESFELIKANRKMRFFYTYEKKLIGIY